MEGFDLACFNGQAERLGCDLQELCGVAKVEPWFDPVIDWLERRDVVARASLCVFMGDELSAGVGVQISLGSGDWGSGISRHWDRRWSFQVGGRGVWAAARL